MKKLELKESTLTSNTRHVNVWLDDVRPEPEGYIRAKTARGCIAMLSLLSEAKVTINHLALDHDLGPDCAGTGYDVVSWVEKMVHTDSAYMAPKIITTHTDNASVRKKMNQAIESIASAMKNRAND